VDCKLVRDEPRHTIAGKLRTLHPGWNVVYAPTKVFGVEAHGKVADAVPHHNDANVIGANNIAQPVADNGF
jgi:hypothetical protein